MAHRKGAGLSISGRGLLAYVRPLDALPHVLLLLLFQDELDEQLLQFLVTVVDAELLKTGNKQIK